MSEHIGEILPKVMDNILRRRTMNIRVNKDWRLTTDANNFIIEKCRIAANDTKEAKKGDEIWSLVAYYSTLDMALGGVVRHSLLESTATTLEEVHSLLAALKDEIQRVREAVE